MTDSVAVVEYGSYAIRAGLAYNFPSDQEPRLVRPNMRTPVASLISEVTVYGTESES